MHSEALKRPAGVGSDKMNEALPSRGREFTRRVRRKRCDRVSIQSESTKASWLDFWPQPRMMRLGQRSPG